MNLITRIVLGAALGAILVLILHPTSRQYYSAAWQYGDSGVLQKTPLLPENIRELPPPTTAFETAYWIQVSADYDRVKRTLNPTVQAQLLEIVQKERQNDPQNAFWHQIESVYLARLGKRAAAEQAWFRAARCLRWNDFQYERLQRIAEGLSAESRGEMSWHWAYLYERRSVEAVNMIARHAQGLIDNSVGEVSSLRIRVATLQNGSLIRDGGRSNLVGVVGARILERASHPESVASQGSQRVLLAARLDFLNNLRKNNLGEEAELVQRLFRGNESWIALATSSLNQDQTKNLQLLALFSSISPGVALSVAALGLALAALGLWMERSLFLQRIFLPRNAPYFGAGMAVAVFFMTRMSLVALLIVLSLGFFAFAPERTSREVPSDLGPMFRFTMVVLGLTFAGLLFLFFSGLGAPGLRLGPVFNLQTEVGLGSPQLLGAAGVVLCLVLMTAPTWAMVRQLPAPPLAGLAIRELGLGVFAFFLLFSILLGPVAVWLDADTKLSLSQIVQNEPTFYLVR
ncbi:MAG TPA: hypothetical protein PLO61_09350 [Fimbriimonadaceae bacterium]|nr:hypothetical protein [Fimbriimonadaceae bacterium]HRJ33835.1 hypothetical protein [Fimbriimonadaceae bacterium]